MSRIGQLTARPILDADALRRAIERMAHQIRESNADLSRVMLIGVQTRGVPLAHRIAAELEKQTGVAIAVQSIDITPYRDDLGPDRAAAEVAAASRFSTDEARVVLVDDVLYTGRTARAALDALVDRGRPDRVQLAVLVDRGHRELPIRPDFVGKNLPSSPEEEVRVLLEETDGIDAVVIVAPSRR